VPERESVRDVLVSREGLRLAELPPGAKVGTGSLRRQAQLLHVRPDLTMRDIRGNVDTRLAKLRAGEYDAIILAEAGLRRLGLANEISEVLPLDAMLPAIGQGALAIEARSDDAQARDAVAPLDHAPTHSAVTAERTLLAALRGGCLAPVAAYARDESDELLQLDAAVLSANGKQRLAATDRDEPARAEQLGKRVAQVLLDQGAAQLIAAARASAPPSPPGRGPG
jgi:hydroxymethylbilane synthase